jgi:hypothetical protein
MINAEDGRLSVLISQLIALWMTTSASHSSLRREHHPDALKVTMARVLHAVQFFDSLEDAWFMGVIHVDGGDHDGINDNRQYLAASPITGHGGGANNSSIYGDWIFPQFLVSPRRQEDHPPRVEERRCESEATRTVTSSMA